MLRSRLMNAPPEPCRYHKLHVLFSGFWWKDRRPAPDELFCSYKRIPKEAKGMLERCAANESTSELLH